MLIGGREHCECITIQLVPILKGKGQALEDIGSSQTLVQPACWRGLSFSRRSHQKGGMWEPAREESSGVLPLSG